MSLTDILGEKKGSVNNKHTQKRVGGGFDEDGDRDKANCHAFVQGNTDDALDVEQCKDRNGDRLDIV